MPVNWTLQETRRIKRQTPGIAVTLHRVETDGEGAEIRRDPVTVPFVTTNGRTKAEIGQDVLAVATRRWLAQEAAEAGVADSLAAAALETALNDWEVTRG